MNKRDDGRAEAVRRIAAILAAAYSRLRFPEPPEKAVDFPETKRDSWTVG